MRKLGDALLVFWGAIGGGVVAAFETASAGWGVALSVIFVVGLALYVLTQRTVLTCATAWYFRRRPSGRVPGLSFHGGVERTVLPGPDSPTVANTAFETTGKGLRRIRVERAGNVETRTPRSLHFRRPVGKTIVTAPGLVHGWRGKLRITKFEAGGFWIEEPPPGGETVEVDVHF